MPQLNIHSQKFQELRFALLFLFTFCVLQYVYSSIRSGMVEHFVIDIATVYPSTAVINFIAPGNQAIASAHRILSPQGSLSILNGCEGTETLFLLIAAIVAFRTSWKNRLKGIMQSGFLIYSLNQVRIITLFFAAHENRKWFDIIHGYIAPSLIIIISFTFFLWWINEVQNVKSTHAA